MEVIITRTFLKDLRSKPKSAIPAVDELISQLAAAVSLEKSGVDYKKWKGKNQGKTTIDYG